MDDVNKHEMFVIKILITLKHIFDNHDIPCLKSTFFMSIQTLVNP